MDGFGIKKLTKVDMPLNKPEACLHLCALRESSASLWHVYYVSEAVEAVKDTSFGCWSFHMSYIASLH